MSLPIRVLIADSDTIFAQSLANFLNDQPTVKVIDLARDGQGAVNLCKDTLPDVVLMDLHLPVLDSVRAIQTILDQNDRIKVLGLSAVDNDRYAVEAIKVGACGCLSKNGEAPFPAIFEAVTDVAKGEVLVNPALASSILQEFHRLSE